LGSSVTVSVWSALAATSASAVSCLPNLRLCWRFGRFISTTSTALARRKRTSPTPKLPLPSNQSAAPMEDALKEDIEVAGEGSKIGVE
jgi:hypothetical protein